MTNLQNIRETIERRLRDRVDAKVLDICEIVNSQVLSRGACFESPPLHSLNFAIIPAQEVPTIAGLEKWFKGIHGDLIDSEIKFKYYPFEWEYHFEERVIAFHNYLSGFRLGCMTMEQIIGDYERIIIEKHRVGLKSGEEDLAQRLSCDKDRRREIVEENKGILESERGSIVQDLPHVERFVFITPYLNLAHFGYAYLKKNGDREFFQRTDGENSCKSPHFRLMKIEDARKYLSKEGFKQFMDECRGYSKDRSLGRIFFDEECEKYELVE